MNNTQHENEHDSILSTIKILITTKGRNIIDPNGNSPLAWAARNGHLQIVQILIEKYQFPVDNQNFEGLTPLAVAVVADNEEIVKYLVKCGAQVNMCDCRGESPLHQAAALGKIDLCRILAEAGGCLDLEDHCGDTPLHFAVREERFDIVEYLLSIGADPHHLNQDSESPYQLAQMVASNEMKKIFNAHFHATSIPNIGTLSLNSFFSKKTKSFSMPEFSHSHSLTVNSLSHSSVWQDEKGRTFPKRLTPDSNLPGGCIGRLVNV